MKTLFIILKVTTGLTLIAPTTLSVTENLEQNQFKSKDNSLDQTVRPSQSFLSNNLFNKKIANKQEDLYTLGKENPHNFFTNQRNRNIPLGSYPSTEGGYTHTGHPGPPGSNQVPDIRFGGGLLFDYKNFNSATKNKINQTLNNGVFGNTNFMSINHTAKDYQGTNDDTTIQQKFLNNNNAKGDIYAQNTRSKVKQSEYKDDMNIEHTVLKQSTYHNFQNAKNPTPDPETNPIVDSTDFNFTPDYTSIPNKPPHQTNILSKNKQLFLTLFNEELYDWYWNTWYTHYNNPDDPGIADFKHQTAEKQQQALNTSKLADSLEFNINLSWNQAIEEKEELPWYAKLGREVVLGALGGALDEVIPGLGPVADKTLGSLLPDGYTKNVETKQLVNYFSPILDQNFMNNLFDQYLGTPDGKYQGLIQQYYKQYGEYPSDVTMKNFDFYTPFSDINIHSQWDWSTDSYVDGSGESINNPGYQANSKIDLSKLLIDMGANFNLNRSDPNHQDLLDRLAQTGTVHILKGECQADKDGKYYAQNNINTSVINDELDNLGYSDITDHLNFSSPKPLQLDKSTSVEVYYKNQYKFTIPILMG